MPYRTEWVEPELFLEHAGVRVYRVYRNDELEQGAQEYHFTLDSEDTGAFADGTASFDVRDLSTWRAALARNVTQDDPRSALAVSSVITTALTSAIDTGEIVAFVALEE